MKNARGMVCVMLLGILVAGGCATQGQKCDRLHPKKKDFAVAVVKLCNANGLGSLKVWVCVTPQPDVYNAWIDMTPVVYMSSGLLNEFADQDVVMPIVAHELSHYALQHIEKRAGASFGVTMLFTVAGVFIPGAGLGNLLVNPLVTNAYGRDQELDADKNAVKMLKNAGVENAVDVYCTALTVIIRKAGSDAKKWDLFAGHPPLEDRIKYVRSTE